MKAQKNVALSLVLLALLSVATLGGEINNPPLQPPPCDPLVQACCPAGQTCPEGGAQTSDTSAEETDDTATTNVADAVVTLLNLTLSLLG